MKTSDKLNAIAMPVYEKKSKAAVKIADQIVKTAYAHARRGEFYFDYKFKKAEQKWAFEIINELKVTHDLSIEETEELSRYETPKSIFISW